MFLKKYKTKKSFDWDNIIVLHGTCEKYGENTAARETGRKSPARTGPDGMQDY
jgi:hypothetical protein